MKKLERMYLMNVVLYFHSTFSVKNFILINKKCLEAIKCLKTNPYSNLRNLNDEIKLFDGMETMKSDAQQLMLLGEEQLNKVKLFDLTSNCNSLNGFEKIKNKIIKINKEIRYQEKVKLGGMCQLRTLRLSMEQQVENSKFWKSVGKLPKLEKLVVSVYGMDLKDIINDFKQINSNKVMVVLKIHHSNENDLKEVIGQFPNLKMCCIENDLKESIEQNKIILLPDKNNSYYVSSHLLFSSNFKDLINNYHPFNVIIEHNSKNGKINISSSRLDLSSYTSLSVLSLKNIQTNKPVSVKLPTTLTSLTIDTCPSFSTLPNLFKIPLKELNLIQNISLVPSTLTSLTLCKVTPKQNFKSFNLLRLSMHSCGSFTSQLPTSLTFVEFQRCSIHSMNLSNPSIVRILHCSQLSSLKINATTDLKLHSCHLLTTIQVCSIVDSLSIINCQITSLLPVASVKALEIQNSLVVLPDQLPQLQHLTLLGSSFYPKSTPTLLQFQTDTIKVPSETITTLHISHCDIPIIFHYPSDLKELNLSFCLELNSRVQLPTTISSLSVSHCPSLDELDLHLHTLETLEIIDCEQLRSVTLPPTLKYLTIHSCENLIHLVNLSQTVIPREIQTHFISHYNQDL